MSDIKGETVITLKTGKKEGEELKLILQPTFANLRRLEVDYSLNLGGVFLRMSQKEIGLIELAKVMHCLCTGDSQQRDFVPSLEELEKHIWRTGLIAVAYQILPMLAAIQPEEDRGGDDDKPKKKQ